LGGTAQKGSQRLGYQTITKTKKPKTPKTPKPKTPIIPLAKTTPTGKEEISMKDILKQFKVFVRKSGKDVELGEFGTLREAKKSLIGELKSTLRASGFVKKGGKKVRLNLFGREFRRGKEDPFRVVQRKTKRLGTTPEVREIQFFKKKKGKGWF